MNSPRTGNIWDRYWFPDAPLLDLAILRIIAVGAQLLLFIFDPGEGFSKIREMGALPSFVFEPIPFLKPILFLLGGHEFTFPEMMGLQLVTTIAAVFAFVGLFTRISMLVFAVGYGVTQLWILSHGDIHHAEAVMVVALAVLALSPCGAVLSLDAMRGRNRLDKADQLTATSREARWPILVMQWFFALMYLSAFYAKLAMSNFQWANGYTLQYYLAEDGMRWNPLLGVWLSQFHWVSFVGQWLILAFQGTFFVSLLIPKLKWIYVPAGMLMHISIYLMLSAPFPQWIALYFVFIPWTAVFEYFGWLPDRARQSPPETTLA
jgi:hypothetical protein